MNIAACVDPLKIEDVPEIQIEPSVEDNTGKTVGYTLGLNGRLLNDDICNLNLQYARVVYKEKPSFYSQRVLCHLVQCKITLCNCS